MKYLAFLIGVLSVLSPGLASPNANHANLTYSSYLIMNPLFYNFGDQLAFLLPPNRPPNCPLTEKLKISRCEPEAREEWNVRDVDFFTETRKFCCFVWDDLRCQLAIVENCDAQYARALSDLYDRLYTDMCEYHSRRSASCALRWWSIMLIVIATILIILGIIWAVFCCIGAKRRRSRKLDRNDSRLGSYNVRY